MSFIRKIKLRLKIKKLKKIIEESAKALTPIEEDENDEESFSPPPYVPYERLGSLKLTDELLKAKRKEAYDAALQEAKREISGIDDGETSYSLKLNLPEGETLLSYLAKQRRKERSFVENLIFYSMKMNVSYQRIYTFAHIDRRLFSKIISDNNYHPSKDTAIALALALRLNIAQASAFLESAGYTLSKSIKRDIAIKFLIENEIFDLDDVNTVLYDVGEKTLGK